MFKPKQLENFFKHNFGKKAKKYNVGTVFKLRGKWTKDRKAYMAILNFKGGVFTCILVLRRSREIILFQREKLKKASIGEVTLEQVIPLELERSVEDFIPVFDRLIQIKSKQEKVESDTYKIKDNKLTGATLSAILGEKFTNKLTRDLKKADQAYDEGGDTGLSDDEYDNKKEQLEFLDPENKSGILKTGDEYVEPDSRERVALPYQIGSQTPVKPGTGQLDQWKKSTKNAKVYVASTKQDGINCLLLYKEGTVHKAYTKSRGGTEGREITAKVKQIPSIPNKIKYKKDLALNLELEIGNKIFAKKYEPKGFKNPRNFVAGLLNKKKVDRRDLVDLDAFAFKVIDPEGMDKQKQFEFLDRLGFKVVDYVILGSKDVNDKNLVGLLRDYKSKSDHAMDGLVVEVNDSAIRQEMEDEKDSAGLNPSYSRKFKLGDEEDIVKVTVKKVIWNVSKQGYLKPRVMLKKPLRLQGVDITFASGFNARFIKDSGIGPGAEIKITRSGDVIPHILETTKPSKPDLPKFCPSSGDRLEWKEGGVELYCPNEECPGRLTKKTISFFRNMSIDFVSSKTIKKFEDYGYDTVDKILSMSVEDMLEIEGIKSTMANKLYDSIHNTLTKGAKGKGISLPQLMDASGFFQSMGSTRLGWVYEAYEGDMLDWTGYKKIDLISELTEIQGIGKEVAKIFSYGIAPFRNWLGKNKKHFKILPYKKKKVSSNSLANEFIVFTGFRNLSWIDIIEKNGGTYQSGVNGDTTILVLKEFKGSSKERKAKKFGAKIMTIPEFEKFLDKKNM